MLLQFYCLLVAILETSHAAHEGHWRGVRVSAGPDGICRTSPAWNVAIVAAPPNKYEYIIGSDTINDTRYPYTPRFNGQKNCDQLLKPDRNPQYKVTFKLVENALTLSYHEDVGNGCLESVSQCLYKVNDDIIINITRFQLCRIGFTCPDVFPETGLLRSGYGWFEGDAAGNFAYGDSNRVAAGVMTAIAVGVLIILLVIFRVVLTEKLAAVCSCLSKPALLWASTIIGFFLLLLIMISCGAPNWSKKIDDAQPSTLGLWLACPSGDNCVNTLSGPKSEEASTSIIFARLCSILSVFLAVPVFVAPCFIAIKMRKDDKSDLQANIENRMFLVVICSLMVAALQFVTFVAWASFHNDVLSEQADKLGYKIGYGWAFDMSAFCWAIAMLVACLLEMYVVRNQGDATVKGPSHIPVSSTGNIEGQQEEQLPSGWEKRKTTDGEIYYFDTATGQTSYEPPPRTTVAGALTTETER